MMEPVRVVVVVAANDWVQQRDRSGCIDMAVLVSARLGDIGWCCCIVCNSKIGVGVHVGAVA